MRPLHGSWLLSLLRLIPLGIFLGACAGVPDVPDGAIPDTVTCRCALTVPTACVSGCGFPGSGTSVSGSDCALGRAEHVCLGALSPVAACARLASVARFALYAIYYGSCGAASCGATVTCEAVEVSRSEACATMCVPEALSPANGWANYTTAGYVSGNWRTSCPGDTPWVNTDAVCRVP